MASFEKISEIDVPVADLAAWHMRRGAFERLAPPWSGARLLALDHPMRDGSKAKILMPVGPLRTQWLAEHRNVDPERGFDDVQVRGPFRKWEHQHRFEAISATRSRLIDRIDYELPVAPISSVLAGAAVHRELERTFAYRHATTGRDLDLHRKYSKRPLKIAVTGATGLVGAPLVALLSTGGHEVLQLSRRDPANGVAWLSWSADADLPFDGRLEGLDAVVHLAGENIASGRWSARRKQAIHDSRIDGTRRLAAHLEQLREPPKVFVGASAIGYYGDRGDELVSEQHDAAADFLGQLCRQWEQAAAPLDQCGVRRVNVRIGVVQSAAGGALATALPAFRFGMGAAFGSGRQWMSWIGLDDLLGVILHAIHEEGLRGAVNAVAPNPCTNGEYARCLARVLRRPAFAKIPSPAVRVLFGELADALLLSSTRVDAAKLIDSGYAFAHAQLEPALRHTLGRAAAAV